LNGCGIGVLGVGDEEVRRDGDVLADGEAENRGGGREREAVDGDVVGDDGLLL
jgi:hypothetical protein